MRLLQISPRKRAVLLSHHVFKMLKLIKPHAEVTCCMLVCI